MQAFQAWNEGSIPSARTTDFGYRAQRARLQKSSVLEKGTSQFRARAGVGEPGQTVNLLSLTEVVRLHPLPPRNRKRPFLVVFYFVQRWGRVEPPEHHDTIVSHENKIFVNNWCAWRLRRRTFSNHTKTDIFNRVFVLWLINVCRGTHPPKPSHQKIHRTSKVRFFFEFPIFAQVRRKRI